MTFGAQAIFNDEKKNLRTLFDPLNYLTNEFFNFIILNLKSKVKVLWSWILSNPNQPSTCINPKFRYRIGMIFQIQRQTEITTAQNPESISCSTNIFPRKRKLYVYHNQLVEHYNHQITRRVPYQMQHYM